MIRIVVRVMDACDAANVGGPVSVIYRTVDIESPELEDALDIRGNQYARAEIVGGHIVAAPHDAPDGGEERR